MINALEITHLTKCYDNRGVTALDNVSLTVSPGDFFALLGPNGAGKSTLIGIVSSLVRKTSGQVKVFGVDLEQNAILAKQYLGLVPQEFNFNQFEKVKDVVITQAGYYGLSLALAKERTEKYLRKLSLWDKRDQPSRTLSGGMKRRLMIARALVHEPKLLILDEPTAGVDVELRRTMWDFLTEINEAGTTIILTTHYLEEAETLCRHVAIIDRGKIIENAPTKMILSGLNQQTFLLDLFADPAVPIVLTGYESRLIETNVLEVVLKKNQSLNLLFQHLSEQNIQVASMKNKSNRLEELFVSLVTRSQGEMV
jgi:ABC-2 type transport system ATP-binding protein